jgi:hypothetical protein
MKKKLMNEIMMVMFILLLHLLTSKNVIVPMNQ